VPVFFPFLQMSLMFGLVIENLIFISASAVKSCSMLIWLKYMKYMKKL